MIDKILALIAPHECLGCASEGSLLCATCAAGLHPAVSACYHCGRVTEDFRTCESCRRSHVHGVRTYTTYEGLAKDIVWRFKFGRVQAAARDIAPLLTLPETVDRDQVLVHIPTATGRMRQRGYDQSALLARQLSALCHIPHVPALARLGQQRQVGSSAEIRRRQLQNTLRVTRPASISGKHIILIDDVVTSGSTLDAAAAVLKQAGAWRIDATVFARA